MLTLFATLSLFYVNAPIEPMRESPNATSEIVSQAVFSEPVISHQEVEGKEGEWVEIETAVDHYRGWVRKSAICAREEPYPAKDFRFVKVNRLAAHVYAVEDTIYGPILTLPFESPLQCIDYEKGSTSRWLKVLLPDARVAYVQRGDILEEEPSILTMEEMCAFSMRFLGLPYTWGGRSSFGYDCSGFVQMLYRHMGVHLPRDSKDQMRFEGFKSVSLDQLQLGDLIFWGSSEEKICHVGMYLEEGRFIHAGVAENSPYITITCLSNPHWNGTSWLKFCAARRLK